MEQLTDHQKKALSASYFAVLEFMLKQPALAAGHARCLIHWALHLELNAHHLQNNARAEAKIPEDRTDKLRMVFHLVYMACLDDVIEDAEVEVAQLFARHLGLEDTVASTMFQAITTADYDELSAEEMENQILAAVEELI